MVAPPCAANSPTVGSSTRKPRRLDKPDSPLDPEDICGRLDLGLGHCAQETARPVTPAAMRTMPDACHTLSCKRTRLVRVDGYPLRAGPGHPRPVDHGQG